MRKKMKVVAAVVMVTGSAVSAVCLAAIAAMSPPKGHRKR